MRGAVERSYEVSAVVKNNLEEELTYSEADFVSFNASKLHRHSEPKSLRNIQIRKLP
jgi:hypothetical protein